VTAVWARILAAGLVVGLGAILGSTGQGLRAQSFVLVDASGETIPEIQPSADAPRPTPFPWLTLDLLAATRDRPLFSPDRRGDEPEPVAVEEEPEPEPEPEVTAEPDATPPQVRLAGVVISGTLRIAMLHDEVEDEVVRLREGQSFSDWTLIAVAPRSVVFRHGTQEHTVVLSAETVAEEDE
jgi:general secretion pathway protein N